MPKFKVLSALAIAATVLTSAFAATAAPNFTCDYSDQTIAAYDMDGDEVLTQDDVECLAKVAAWDAAGGTGALPGCFDSTLITADLNGDGSVGITDVLRLARAVNHFGACTTYGDLNGNDKVNVVDIQCMVKAAQWDAAGANGPAPICLSSPEAADLDCDGDIDFMDLQLVGHVASTGSLNQAIDQNGNGVHDSCE